MCGRYVQTASPAELAERFLAEEVRADEVEADYNVTPRQGVPIVASTGDHRVVDRVRWGLVPSWAPDPSIGDRMINARAETIARKPGYRGAFAKRRCLVPADGFYEWRARRGRRVKQPYYVRRRDGDVLAFAGLWEVWKDPADEAAEWMRSCAIVTTDANTVVAPIHSRMPVVLPESAWEEWLDPANHDVAALQRLLVPAPAEWLEAYPVRTAVNDPRHNGPELLERAPEDELADGPDGPGAGEATP